MHLTALKIVNFLKIIGQSQSSGVLITAKVAKVDANRFTSPELKSFYLSVALGERKFNKTCNY